MTRQVLHAKTIDCLVDILSKMYRLGVSIDPVEMMDWYWRSTR